MTTKECSTDKCTPQNSTIVLERYENFPETAQTVLHAFGLRRGNIINRCSHCNTLWVYIGLGRYPLKKTIGIYDRKTKTILLPENG